MFLERPSQTIAPACMLLTLVNDFNLLLLGINFIRSAQAEADSRIPGHPYLQMNRVYC